MLFDDRLATVLRHRAESGASARTQYRQLVDLLGDAALEADGALLAAAYLRLDALATLIPVRERARFVVDAGSRLRNPALIARLAEAEPDVAAAVLANARLPDAEWARLIPELPMRARGFLRHRDGLPPKALETLDRLGVQDRVLPEPAPLELSDRDTVEREPAATETGPAPAPSRAAGDIGALVERIQAYTRARGDREVQAEDPRLPLDEEVRGSRRGEIASFVAGIDSRGRIELADAKVAPMVVGTDLPTACDGFAAAFRDRLPLVRAPVELRGAPSIAGQWLVDATPRFHPTDGRFLGYAARLSRPTEESAADRAESAADRIRQLLHELRTPVNAIQGFAEVIQQQLFGTTPHEYRALAASIAGDAARMLAGFDELDRLAKLESDALRLEPGRSDFAAVVRAQLEQLRTVLSARVSRFDAVIAPGAVALPITEDEAQMLAWRIFATLVSATGAGETLGIDLSANEGRLTLRSDLPAALVGSDDIFSTDTRPTGGAVSAGIFGAGFALRLARAEARACGGDLARVDDGLELTLPLLTATAGEPSPERLPDRASR